MPHVALPNLPGISSLFEAFPDAAQPLQLLAQTLLRGPSPLTSGERELIAAYVSRRNGCEFCSRSHAASAREQVETPGLVDAVLGNDLSGATPRMRALLAVADEVRAAVAPVSDAAIARAREAGADDRMLHDAVLIAAAFCMYNRYVDGLATVAPRHDEAYVEMGKRLATVGYVRR